MLSEKIKELRSQITQNKRRLIQKSQKRRSEPKKTNWTKLQL
ncbi:hypothetical protein S101413_02934 [Bacillus velezensis]|nr:hypothetical protein S101413_02934 [Bacillus velezensis]